MDRNGNRRALFQRAGLTLKQSSIGTGFVRIPNTKANTENGGECLYALVKVSQFI